MTPSCPERTRRTIGLRSILRSGCRRGSASARPLIYPYFADLVTRDFPGSLTQKAMRPRTRDTESQRPKPKTTVPASAHYAVGPAGGNSCYAIYEANHSSIWLGAALKFQVAVPAPRGALHPMQLLLGNRNAVEYALYVTGVGQHALSWLRDLCASGTIHAWRRTR
jgi:hypothetical protein